MKNIKTKLIDKKVASGFDAAAGDELGGCFVTPACYSHMTHMLMTLANGKVAVCLEVSKFLLFPSHIPPNEDHSYLTHQRVVIISALYPSQRWQ